MREVHYARDDTGAYVLAVIAVLFCAVGGWLVVAGWSAWRHNADGWRRRGRSPLG